MDFHALVARVKRHEGFRSTPYRDAEGWAIGYGRNLTFNPITEHEAEVLLQNDLMRVIEDLQQRISFWSEIDSVRQEALTEMAYNLGVGGLMKFARMLEALEANRYADAEYHALDSKWARQVGHRAKVLARMLRTGERP